MCAAFLTNFAQEVRRLLSPRLWHAPLCDKHFELLSSVCRLGMPHLFFPLRYVVFLKSIGIAAGIRADLVLELPPDRYPAAAQPFIAAITDPTVARVVQLFGPRVCGGLRYCALVVAVCSSDRICLCELRLSLSSFFHFSSRACASLLRMCR